MKPAAVLLMGPTASGKTDVAIELASRWPFEIINVDSALVYRGMDIGTGKPDAATLQRYPHHLVDILDPSEPYSAGRFIRDVTPLIIDIHRRERVPLLVGGTMLYFRALLHGLADMPAADLAFRTALDARAAALGWPVLHAELAQRDPLAASRIGPNDAQRIQRALEVITLTGRPLSVIQQQAHPPLPTVNFIKLALSPAQREVLYNRIEARFNDILARGFVDEVRRLQQRGDLHSDLPSMRAVGYRQLWQHVIGEWSLSQASEQAVLATRHLARRQLIWLRADTQLQWIDSTATDTLTQLEQHVSPIFG